MCSLAVPSDAVPFEPGRILAARYRLIERLGGVESGEIWRADDLVLGTAVAVRVARARTDGEREAVLAPARLVRAIAHPAIRQVFDIGEADGVTYAASELVNGEDLETLLRRAGRLPSERVAEIGRQLCSALEAIHEHGVVHGRLGPATVLLDEHGVVRLADAGAGAAASDHAPSVPGPDTDTERGSPGAAPSPRSDLHDVGVLLYQLLVGTTPSANRRRAGGTPEKPSALVPDVHPPLERIILQALHTESRRRPASAGMMAASLGRVVSTPAGGTARAWLAGAAVALAVGALAVLSSWVLPDGAGALTEQDTIVLADFRNTTGEPVFDRALNVALAVALEQSPFLRVLPEERARETLARMQRERDEPVTVPLAREIARRERLKAFVAGSIGRLGTRYVLALEVLHADSGEVLAREQVEVAAKEEILTALGQAAAALRNGLGESLPSIQRFDAPLPQATTPSLEALHAYALALDQGRVLPRVEAIPHLKRAIELDPDFAMAHALLSGVYANTGRSAEAPAFSRRAFELRDRVSERERFFISWRYYLDAVQAWDEAQELSVAWTRTYPRDAFAFNSLGLSSAAFGDHTAGVRAFREAIRLDPGFVPPHGNLAGSLIALNRLDEARALLDEAQQRGIDFISVRRMSYVLAFLENDPDGMARELDLVRSSADPMWASLWEARTLAFSGRIRAAHAAFGRGVAAARAAGRQELAAQWMMEDAESHALTGGCGVAQQEVQQGLELARDNFTLERAARTLAFCGAGEVSSRLSDELRSRYAEATLTIRLQVPVIAAAHALRQGQAERAVDLLEAVKPYDRAPSAEFWPAYLRGGAYLQLNDGRAAAEQFETILRHRGEAPTSPLYPLAHLGVARAAALAGETEVARTSFEAFLSSWDGADSDILPLIEARAAYARLQ